MTSEVTIGVTPPSPVHLETRRQWRTLGEMRTRPITVAETAVFMRQASALWADHERFEFVDFIARNPEAGDLVPASGGVRKVRWRRQGSGKRGGVRVIYFYHDPGMPLYLLMIYAKARRDDLSPDARRTVQALVGRLKEAYGR
jgi:hypothetical protein